MSGLKYDFFGIFTEAEKIESRKWLEEQNYLTIGRTYEIEAYKLEGVIIFRGRSTQLSDWKEEPLAFNAQVPTHYIETQLTKIFEEIG